MGGLSLQKLLKRKVVLILLIPIFSVAIGHDLQISEPVLSLTKVITRIPIIFKNHLPFLVGIFSAGLSDFTQCVLNT